MSEVRTPKTFYENQLSKLKLEETQQLRLSRFWVILRLVSFLLIPLVIWIFYTKGSIVILACIAALILFLYCVRKSIENKEKLNFIRELIRINNHEISVLEGDFSAFENGEMFQDLRHPYSHDLDIFGERSIYQFLNRCVSTAGKKLLAQRLTGEVAGSLVDQQAIEELASQGDWCQKFRASHISSSEIEIEAITLEKWLTKTIDTPKFYGALRFILPLLGWALTILYYFDFISGVIYTLGAIPVLLPAFQRLTITNKISADLEKLEKTIIGIQRQNQLLHELSVCSPLLNQLKSEAAEASTALKTLALYCKRAGQRNNVLVGVLLNFLFAWDIRLNFDLVTWKNKYSAKAPVWEQNVNQLEVLISAATFRYNQYPTTTFATIGENENFHIEAIAHPLLLPEKRVVNDFNLKQEQLFTILTGPNMAGKSTFLRSLGVNYVLAKAGFPVVAKSFLAPNLNLYSSMRNTDDLSAATSYFHAELLRLRFIVDAIEKHDEKVLIILDEILKGTNSKDKEEGSAMFLKKLCALNARGIIATHDLKLTDLSENNPQIINRYFDSTIHDEEMSFDYKIRDGVAQNMNASFLLRKMGLS